MSPQSYVMVPLSSPAHPSPLPFISSTDSNNVNSTSDTSPDLESRHAYYPSPTKAEPKVESVQPSEYELSSIAAATQNSGESGGEHESAPVGDKPVLQTDGVVSSEVGDVPGILHQDLHPDGQPRRPMNAFMIFARHRRPAIQAKEPGLKTGEISKRLSHDWKNLPEEDKSHYLEQAKLLKDEFHSKFPEYVYKRRPNNTGKRRSSTSQQQLHPKYGCGPGGAQSIGMPQGPVSGGMPHPADVHAHHYHHHLHPHHDIYNTGHPHHLSHHHHVQLPPRPLSSVAQHSPKLGPQNFYPSSNNPTSPRHHHHMVQTTPGSNCGTMGPRHPGHCPPRGSLPSTATTIAPSDLRSPRPASPGVSSGTPNGMSYMRVSNPHVAAYPMHSSSNQYPWFANEQQPYNSSGHHVGQAPTPLSANRPSFQYSSWPSSVNADSQSISASGLNNNEPSDPNYSVSHSRATSYSAGPPIYRAPSPVDRGRQLSLPSHSMSTGAAEAASNVPSDSGSPYSNRPSHDHHSGSTGPQNSGNPNYGAYSSSDMLCNSQRPAYSAAPVSSGYGSNSVRNSMVSSVNGPQAGNDPHSGFEQLKALH